MKITVGRDTNDFHVYDDSGVDITQVLNVTYMRLELLPMQATKVHLTCYAEVEVTPAEVDILPEDRENGQIGKVCTIGPGCDYETIEEWLFSENPEESGG